MSADGDTVRAALVDGWCTSTEREAALAALARLEAAEAAISEAVKTAERQWAESERDIDLLRGGYELALAEKEAAVAQRDALAAALRWIGKSTSQSGILARAALAEAGLE